MKNYILFAPIIIAIVVFVFYIFFAGMVFAFHVVLLFAIMSSAFITFLAYKFFNP